MNKKYAKLKYYRKNILSVKYFVPQKISKSNEGKMYI